MITRIEIFPLAGIPLIKKDDDLSVVLLDALAQSGLELADDDVLVIAQKIISKAEGRLIKLSDVAPSEESEAIAQRVGKDPRLVELILGESREVMRERPGVLIVRHRLGLVLANAGIDQSNIDHAQGEVALLLPIDPDASCEAIRSAVSEKTGADIAVMIIDSLGRAWRMRPRRRARAE